MVCFKRRRWTVVLTLVTATMFVFNILFLVDLTINHQAHNHLIDALQDGLVDEEKREEPDHIPHPLKQSYVVKVMSSKEGAEIWVKDKLVHNGTSLERGIHLAVLNHATGQLMAVRVFDTYVPGSEDDMISFFNSISDNRVLCLAIVDEGTFSLKENGRSGLKALGSQLTSSLSWRDMWAMVAVKGEGRAIGEDIGKSTDVKEWGGVVRLTVTISASKSDSSAISCDWPDTVQNQRRRDFCSKHEGYGSLCHCANPLPLTFDPTPLIPNNVADVPVAIIASNRPLYLFRMLRRLLSVPGARVDMVTVFIDGYFQEPVAVTELFGVRAVQHEPRSQKNGRISQHYKASLSGIFDLYPTAPYTIVLEEDLEVSPDFFSYFSQTVSLMEEDDSIYCISAWNDQGYQHSSEDPALLYRVETMPGLGWLLKRKLFKDELEPNWPSPDKLWDWDMWMRLDTIRKNRECVIPDISRTFHFGASGLNMNPYFHERYFKKHVINKIPNVTFKDVRSVTKDNYELVIHSLFREGSVLDHNRDPCSSNFIPNTKGKVYVMYITMEKAKHFDHWLKLASCFKIWDLDARGFHKGMWRFWMNGNHILVVGHPFSPYSAKYKPLGIEPLVLATPSKPP